MIPKVRSVESLILTNQSSDQFVAQFRKIIFHNGAQFLILQRNDKQKVLKIKCCDDAVKLIGPKKEEFEELIDYFREGHTKTQASPIDSDEEYWVIGISFNKVETKGGLSLEFKISDEKPIDILPYIIQTGAEHVFFSE
ncbi:MULTISPECIES: hypothetical protein [Paenibacillus]|uniref:hypothetical protein n=1 Tax=Paenibacillus TaxID=44249 RepID=UPI000970814D|nr:MULTISPECIES: hypothetical protein [Paenibacillus]ASS68154.1 hypothetical protein CIC07_19960 [Paenibacillus sp. RUD330]MEC0246354.1 hypothetical protein [Paenibacillus chitinolyticus]